jgi:hypothetical protein
MTMDEAQRIKDCRLARERARARERLEEEMNEYQYSAWNFPDMLARMPQQARRDAYLDQVADLTSAWQRRR